MELLFKNSLEKFRQDEAVHGVLAVDISSLYSAVTDGLDYLLLVISRRPETDFKQVYYIEDGKRIQERRISSQAVEELILNGDQPDIVYWILEGEILLDRDMYLDDLRHRILEFPDELRDRKLLIEFSKFMRSCLQSKKYFAQDYLLDAYNEILKALHHWARIVIVEAGRHPEITLWDQVKQINPGVYKLYEELTTSVETLKQRVQLVQLACEFSVMSRMERCCRVILDVLASRKEPWSLQELQQVPELIDIQWDLPLLLNKLVKKQLVSEIVYTEDLDFNLLELRYSDAKITAI